MRRILSATKRSSSSADALALAIELAAAQRAELILVHVIPTLDGGDFDEDAIAIPHEATDDERQVLEDAAAAAHDHGVSTKALLLRGPTADEILAAAELHDVDLIVVGSRGHSAIASALFGDVSLRVLRRSTRPVLVVRHQSPRRSAESQSISVLALP